MWVLLFIRRLLLLFLHLLRRSLNRSTAWLLGFMDYFNFHKPSTPKDKWPRSIRDSDEEYDSTWEGEDETENKDNESTPARMQSFWKTKTYRNVQAAKDMQHFRRRCRKALSDTKADTDDDDSFETKNLPNLHFYQNITCCMPDGLYIEELLREWYGDYDKLEYVHTYIQWLFPIQEHGMNFESHVLTQKEIKLFHKQEEVKRRLLKSYKLMLDFYGIKLYDERTGEVVRADNWRKRFENLNSNSHNNLRITRILKCLALLGFEHYQAPLVWFFLNETLVKGTLPQVKKSVLDYFLFSVINKDKLRDLIKFAIRHFEPADQFVWCPKRIQIKLREATHSTTSKTENISSKKQGKASATSSELMQSCLPTNVRQNQGQHQRDQSQDTNKDILGSLQGKKKNVEKNHDFYQPPNDEAAPKTHDNDQVKKAQSEEHPGDEGDRLMRIIQINDDDSKPEEQNKKTEVCEEDNILVKTSEQLNVNICKEQPLVQKSSSGTKEDVLTNTGTNIGQQNSEQEMENSSEQTEPTETAVGPNNASNDKTIQQTYNNCKNHQLKSAENIELTDLKCQKDKSETSATTNLNTSDLEKRTHGASQDKHGAEEKGSESGTRDKCRDQGKSNGQTAALNEPPNDQRATTNSEQTPEGWFPEQR